jgi:DNA polymerase-3 subunit alpha
MEVSVPEVLADGQRGPVVIKLPTTRAVPAVVDALKQVLHTHAGTTAVQVHLESAGSSRVLQLGDSIRVQPSTALFADLKALLGPHCLG